MSKFTRFRDAVYIEVGNALIGMLLDKLKGTLSRKGNDAGSTGDIPEPPTFHGGSDGVDGVQTGQGGVRYEEPSREVR